MSYRFCTAVTEAEREQVHLLNYEIFVEEIPQHQPNPERRLLDRFHGENTYFQCWRHNELVGMVCTRDKRPFSQRKIGLGGLPTWLTKKAIRSVRVLVERERVAADEGSVRKN